MHQVTQRMGESTRLLPSRSGCKSSSLFLHLSLPVEKQQPSSWGKASCEFPAGPQCSGAVSASANRAAVQTQGIQASEGLMACQTLAPSILTMMAEGRWPVLGTTGLGSEPCSSPDLQVVFPSFSTFWARIPGG